MRAFAGASVKHFAPKSRKSIRGGFILSFHGRPDSPFPFVLRHFLPSPKITRREFRPTLLVSGGKTIRCQLSVVSRQSSVVCGSWFVVCGSLPSAGRFLDASTAQQRAYRLQSATKLSNSAAPIAW
ncbi:hypothetical protein Pan181_11990 [Aeoliella mucimassa]|uniref:Uncharacterized protein n=1 Tax=Aeoliella mucimassa TaxID=2527972 RepID=A0A518AK02_9BACT|nr:hypothetical protein Pan181_11990 [Aeoliella mucimassa]